MWTVMFNSICPAGLASEKVNAVFDGVMCSGTQVPRAATPGKQNTLPRLCEVVAVPCCPLSVTGACCSIFLRGLQWIDVQTCAAPWRFWNVSWMIDVVCILFLKEPKQWRILSHSDHMDPSTSMAAVALGELPQVSSLLHSWRTRLSLGSFRKVCEVYSFGKLGYPFGHVWLFGWCSIQAQPFWAWSQVRNGSVWTACNALSVPATRQKWATPKDPVIDRQWSSGELGKSHC